MGCGLFKMCYMESAPNFSARAYQCVEKPAPTTSWQTSCREAILSQVSCLHVMFFSDSTTQTKKCGALCTNLFIVVFVESISFIFARLHLLRVRWNIMVEYYPRSSQRRSSSPVRATALLQPPPSSIYNTFSCNNKTGKRLGLHHSQTICYIPLDHRRLLFLNRPWCVPVIYKEHDFRLSACTRLFCLCSGILLRQTFSMLILFEAITHNPIDRLYHRIDVLKSTRCVASSLR